VNDPQNSEMVAWSGWKKSEDLTRHDKWLCMMYRRLKLLNKLLAEDGAIFISIDEMRGEFKLSMDEISSQKFYRKRYVGLKRERGLSV